MAAWPAYRRGGLALLLVGMAAVPAMVRAETQLFDSATYTAWADLRLAYADGERSWLDGGFGKLRHGGETAADIAQLAILWKPQLTDTVSGYVLLQGVSDAAVPVGVEEAYVQWRPVPRSGFRFNMRAGQMFPPISMEHDGTGWTVPRTLTPSAINTWIGEEVLVRGVEISGQANVWGQGVGLTLGGFTRDDTAGTILSWRGWALHDISSAENTALPLPEGQNQGWYRLFKTNQAAQSRPMVEVDERLGYYARIDWRPPAPFALNLEVYDNQGDPMALRNGQWGWATRFYNVGAAYRLNAQDELLTQYMAGHTATGWAVGQGRRVVDVDFESAYMLWSRRLQSGGRLSARFDWFGAKDYSRRAVDDNGETGYSATFAWLRPVSDHLDCGLEALHVISDRPARVTHDLSPKQAQTQIQVALKLHL
ncbi:hypothetical protein [Asticcacaulis sp. 201]|uniref:hypothetical protein n=1 Tax=Asticcacaulis sp. 201 TaxID=3028787 RepID=UPI002916293A|nr:hypothetical protein [Asticcacaulis sp. 201]MDV6332421.1 hypothetical protein [Asticcacaulis sp. 201]